MRTCVNCGAADNPLGTLKFKRHLGGDVYCERCSPDLLAETSPPLVILEEPSAGSPPVTGELVVISCPDCAGGVHRPHGKPCSGCAGLGAVRYPASALVIYTPKVKTEPVAEVLLED